MKNAINFFLCSTLFFLSLFILLNAHKIGHRIYKTQIINSICFECKLKKTFFFIFPAHRNSKMRQRNVYEHRHVGSKKLLSFLCELNLSIHFQTETFMFWTFFPVKKLRKYICKVYKFSVISLKLRLSRHFENKILIIFSQEKNRPTPLVHP